MTSEPVKKSPNSLFPILITVAAIIVAGVFAIIVAGVFIYNNFAQRNDGAKSLDDLRDSANIDNPAPAIQAAGWINGETPVEDDFKGKVIVVDAFAYWCGPCRQAAPEMIALHEKYSRQGVFFIGLTGDGANKLPNTKQFIEDTQIPWVVGYGASKTLSALNNKYIPHVWVFDKQGQIIFTAPNPRIHLVEDAITKALNGEP